MGKLDQLADNWFTVCKEYIVAEFGDTVQLRRSPVGGVVTTILGVPEAGGNIRCFNLGERTWDVMEDDAVHVDIAHDGTVSVGYSLEDQADQGMKFKVGHPREVAELLRLLDNPDSFLALADAEIEYGGRKLGEIAEFHVLIPVGETWRVIDPSALPAEAPDEFRKAFYLNLTRDWDHFLAGETCEAWRFASRWPDFVKTLPLATPLAQAGYVLDPNGTMKSAVDYPVIPPDIGQTFFDMMIVSAKKEVSSLYLRESVNGDKETGKKIQTAFTRGSGLETLMEAIKSVPIHMPVEIRHQIRIAAEHNAIRQWLLFVGERIANQRDCFFTMADKHWHLAHALDAMVDREQLEG